MGPARPVDAGPVDHLVAVHERGRTGEYGAFERAEDPDYRRDLLFSYVDSRDGAASVALALAAAEPGFEVYDIAASDTGSAVPSAELCAHHFPGVPVREGLGEFETLVSVDKARDRLGFVARHLWREEYAAQRAAEGGATR
ncbi:hypothetical protein GCM10025870_15800 [Agromyces marinus]|uniref:Uncharacterized protein n=1 Tax=Agromyces marinus TaxID=1389020 RepID=A0ABM8H146_9MICO|nr:hypothetical protein GCM10025870_15800 [Agromyces marinus]